MAGAARAIYRSVVSGALTLDLGIGRRVRPLGPLTVQIDAPRDLVFDVVAAPYLGNAGREAAEKIEVLDRGTDLVVAAHRTPTSGGLVATTVEAVKFDRPQEITFRLLRGPVPHVTERFDFEEEGESTILRYEGELGTDFGALGSRWGDVVAQAWVEAVRQSLDQTRTRSEERQTARRRRGSQG